MAAGLKRFLFSLKWMTMSQRKRYAYLWARGGSLRSSRHLSMDDVDDAEMSATETAAETSLV